ncbi:hypothetical protein H5410_056301 [Solanum commersonii]|uniref:Secreted protein n=1 Tax=Solanum commersonii TaxID=4109 RepID=A0A9J5WLR7_SOLCO|nr:hypothetical protein H5410_056301 [Solanum commersonii]
MHLRFMWTVLILLKGVLFACASRLISDKENLGFVFLVMDWKRGTCQVSARIMGSNSYHGRKLSCQSSITINGWLRRFLMGTCIRNSMVLHYPIWPFFLGAHFVRALSLMFLFTDVLLATRRALSIIQGRLCRSNPLPFGWNCHNMGILLSKNYCRRIMARRI